MTSIFNQRSDQLLAIVIAMVLTAIVFSSTVELFGPRHDGLPVAAI